jgi:hypothetical protein
MLFLQLHWLNICRHEASCWLVSLGRGKPVRYLHVYQGVYSSSFICISKSLHDLSLLFGATSECITQYKQLHCMFQNRNVRSILVDSLLFSEVLYPMIVFAIYVWINWIWNKYEYISNYFDFSSVHSLWQEKVLWLPEEVDIPCYSDCNSIQIGKSRGNLTYWQQWVLGLWSSQMSTPVIPDVIMIYMFPQQIWRYFRKVDGILASNLITTSHQHLNNYLMTSPNLKWP